MTITNSSNSSDIAGYLDQDDLFSSAVVYQLPRLTKNDYTLTYLMREDLVSSLHYGSADYTGSVIISAGAIVDVEDKSIIKNYEVRDTLEMIEYSELSDYLPNTRQSNTLSDAELSSETKEEQETVRYYWSGSSFTKSVISLPTPILSFTPGDSIDEGVISISNMSDFSGYSNLTFYYTTDGSAPTLGSDVLTDSINTVGNYTYKVKAVLDDLSGESEVGSLTVSILQVQSITIVVVEHDWGESPQEGA